MCKVSRVAHTLSFMYAPHEHAQHRRQHVLSVACPGSIRVADIQGNVAPRANPCRRSFPLLDCSAKLCSRVQSPSAGWLAGDAGAALDVTAFRLAIWLSASSNRG